MVLLSMDGEVGIEVSDILPANYPMYDKVEKKSPERIIAHDHTYDSECLRLLSFALVLDPRTRYAYHVQDIHELQRHSPLARYSPKPAESHQRGISKRFFSPMSRKEAKEVNKYKVLGLMDLQDKDPSRKFRSVVASS